MVTGWFPGFAPGFASRLGVACVLALTAWGFTACGGSFSAGPSDGGGNREAGGVDDAAPPDDAGTATDGGAPGDASGGRWCSAQHGLFCEDFDGPGGLAQLLASWTTSQQSSGMFAFDTSADVPSPPRALEVNGSSSAQVVVIESFAPLPPNVKSARLEMDLRIDSASSVKWLSSAGFMAILMGTQVADGYVGVAVSSGPSLVVGWSRAGDAGTANDAGGNGVDTVMGPFPPTGTWAGRFALAIDYGATEGQGACAQLYEGPTPMLAQCIPLPPDLSNPTALAIAVGDYTGGFGDTGYVQMRFDNVTFDVKY
jgi:hypothetical protein